MSAMWCGNPNRHPAHDWGTWSQHHCNGKRDPKNATGGKPT